MKAFSEISLETKLISGAVILVVLAGGTIAVVHYAHKKQQEKGSATDVNLSKSTANTLSNQGIKASYGPAQYSVWANTLQQAFDGCGYAWQNQQPIWKAMRNDTDIEKLIEAYGQRSVDKCGLLTGNTDKLDLAAILAYKYSGVEYTLSVGEGSIAEINTILKNNGLTFQF